MSGLTRQAIFLTVEKASHLTGAMLLLIAVARLLGEDALGTYAYVIAITSVFVPILDVGLNTRVIRAVAAGDGAEAWQDAVAFKLRFGPLAVLVMVACAWFVGKSGDVIVAVLLVGISTWAMSVGDVFNAVFKGLKKASYCALLVGGTYLCLTGLGIGAMVYDLGIMGIAVAYVICRGGFWAGAYVLFRRLGYAIGGQFRWQAIWAGVRFMPAVFFVGVLLNLCFIVSDGLGAGAESGMYAIGYRVSAALFVLVSASMEGVLPALVSVVNQRDVFRRLFLRCCGLFLLGGIVAVGLVQLLGYWAVVWVFGVDYVGAVEAVKVLSWILPPLLVCAAAHTALLALGHEGEGLVWMVCLVLVGAVLGGVGFEWAGYWGTALAPMVTGGIFAVGLGWRVQWYLKKYE